MIRRPFAALAAVLLAVGLAACGSASSGSADSEAPHRNPTTAQPRNSKSPRVNERNNFVKHIGDLAAITDENGKDVVDWTVTNIVIDPQCTGEYAQPPKNGHYVELDISMSATSGFTGDKYGSLMLGSPSWWTYVQADGTQWNGHPDGNSFGCMPDDQTLPQQFNQGTKASGKVIFDVPSTDGSLVFTTGVVQGGWEYPLSSEGKA